MIANFKDYDKNDTFTSFLGERYAKALERPRQARRSYQKYFQTQKHYQIEFYIPFNKTIFNLIEQEKELSQFILFLDEALALFQMHASETGVELYIEPSFEKDVRINSLKVIRAILTGYNEIGDYINRDDMTVYAHLVYACRTECLNVMEPGDKLKASFKIEPIYTTAQL